MYLSLIRTARALLDLLFLIMYGHGEVKLDVQDIGIGKGICMAWRPGVSNEINVGNWSVYLSIHLLYYLYSMSGRAELGLHEE